MSNNVMEGGQAIIKCLENEGVEYIFGYSGGAAIPIFDALVTTDTKINFVLTRHEQGAAHMADGYARATGKPAVVLVTSGPGATNTITGIMTAHMDSVPMIVLTGQSVSWMLGKDTFQEADIFGITMPIVKHSYLVKATNDIPRIVREAFHIATTGRPGPVLIDIPKDISAGPCTADLHAEMDLPGYQLNDTVAKDTILEIAQALAKALRPPQGSRGEGKDSGHHNAAGKRRISGNPQTVTGNAGDAWHGLCQQGHMRMRPAFEYRFALR